MEAFAIYFAVVAITLWGSTKNTKIREQSNEIYQIELKAMQFADKAKKSPFVLATYAQCTFHMQRRVNAFFMILLCILNPHAENSPAREPKLVYHFPLKKIRFCKFINNLPVKLHFHVFICALTHTNHIWLYKMLELLLCIVYTKKRRLVLLFQCEIVSS